MIVIGICGDAPGSGEPKATTVFGGPRNGNEYEPEPLAFSTISALTAGGAGVNSELLGYVVVIVYEPSALTVRTEL